jgi:hypothetical protein
MTGSASLFWFIVRLFIKGKRIELAERNTDHG